jgi:hypothetical protein
MRAVALSDKTVQEKVAKSFVPLKVVIPYGSKEFPLDWESMNQWRLVYKLMGGEKATGLTGCAVVSSDGKVEYANTGSAFVWELFDSTAYDAEKFAAMLDRGADRASRERTIRNDAKLSDVECDKQLASFHKEVRAALAKEGKAFGKPKGFTDLHALELFYLSGDLFWNPSKK